MVCRLLVARPDEQVHQFLGHAGLTPPQDGYRPFDASTERVGLDEPLLACPGDRPENEGSRVRLTGRVPLRLGLEPVVEVVGLELADAPGAKLHREPSGHDVEHAGNPALAGGVQVKPVLVEEGGDEVIVGALIGLQFDELAEAAHGLQVGLPLRPVVGAFR